MIKFKVEENLATPKSFKFDGAAVCTDEQLPGDCCWDEPILNNTLIQVEQGVNFGFQWSVSGCLVPLLKCSHWKVQLHFEKWGEPEFDLGALGITQVKYVPESGYTYNTVISLRPNTVPEGVYDIVAVIRMYDYKNNPVPVAGFAELGKIQFYEASSPTI
jgi:hypothetical protein